MTVPLLVSARRALSAALVVVTAGCRSRPAPSSASPAEPASVSAPAITPPDDGGRALLTTALAPGAPALTIAYPINESVFPPDIAPPLAKWQDDNPRSDRWLVAVDGGPGQPLVREVVSEGAYRFTESQWASMQARAQQAPLTIDIVGFARNAQAQPTSRASVSISSSADRVEAGIFFRQVPLPFDFANHHTERIRYSLGYVEHGRPPRVLLEGLPVCGNCHSFSRDGHTLGMDVDYANDKGSYVITALAAETRLTPDKIITWSDYRRADRQLTFGLLSQVSPDGRYVVSTVKDRSIFVGLPDRLEYSQLFFPIRGILAIYDREHKNFQALPGADDARLVQSNANWTPDGKQLLFARATAYHSARVEASKGALVPVSAASEFLSGERGFQFDVYRIPFNGGHGGKAEAVLGASHNGMSNYFPRVSPNGKWLVFTQSKNFMLLQPDSKLWLMKPSGGEPRLMRCNTPNTNSWHSWSPSGRWLVFSSKARGIYTQLWLTHIDDDGNDSPPVLLENLISSERAANIPEFIATEPGFLQKIVDGFSDGGNYHYRVAKTLIHYGDLEPARQRLELAITRTPLDVDVWLERGAVLFRLGKRAESYESFRKAMQLSPTDYRGPYDLGISQLAAGQLEDAAANLTEAIRLDAHVPEAWFQRALAYSKLGDTAHALTDVKQAIELDPKAEALHRLERELEERANLE